MMKKKKAEMGIGTLIIFIAMILVAAVAAGVLIQTSGSLQSKALLTGERSKDQIATALQAVSIAAEDGSTGNDVDTFYFTVRLAPGSDDIRLADTLASVATADMSANYKYNSSADCDSVPAATTNTYAVKYLLGGNSPGYVTQGDVVMVCYKTSSAIGENEEVTFALTPKVGNRLVVDTSLPEVITDFRTQVYPSG